MPVMPLQARQDSKYFKVSAEDPSIKTETEGGYVYSRPRHTRIPRKTWITGFTELDDASKVIFEAFWDTVRGGSDSFDWTEPVSQATKLVRFAGMPDYKYVGINGVHLWNITGITIEEV